MEISSLSDVLPGLVVRPECLKVFQMATLEGGTKSLLSYREGTLFRHRGGSMHFQTVSPVVIVLHSVVHYSKEVVQRLKKENLREKVKPWLLPSQRELDVNAGSLVSDKLQEIQTETPNFSVGKVSEEGHPTL